MKPQASRPDPHWTPAARLAFRFALVYLGIVVLVTQIAGSLFPNLLVDIDGLGALWPIHDITVWVARHVFGVDGELDPITGGEPLLFWVQWVWLLPVAVVATLVWSVADRGRTQYVRLHAWSRLVFRFALAAQLIEYGMTKVIPTQFPAPSLVTLVTPTGDLTLSALLWTSIGAAPAYQLFTGCVEVLGGVLLVLPQTTLAGAVISLAAMVQVFALNMTYDIGVKLVSFHLILLALFLLAPDMPRLAAAVAGNRPVAAAAHAPLTRTLRGNRLALAAQLAFGAYLLGMYTYLNVAFWHAAGGGAPKSPLYGIWNVEQLAIDGDLRSPEQNDYDRRWRRLIFDEPGTIVFQRTDDSFARYGASIDAAGRTLALTKGASRTWGARFDIDRPSPDRLVVQGDMDGYRIDLRLRLVELDTFRLLNSTFRWVRPHDQ